MSNNRPTLKDALNGALGRAGYQTSSRGTIARVTAIGGGQGTAQGDPVYYTINCDLIRGSTQIENVENGFYLCREVKRSQIVYDFFLVEDGAARHLGHLLIHGVRDERILSPLFDRKLIDHLPAIQKYVDWKPKTSALEVNSNA